MGSTKVTDTSGGALWTILKHNRGFPAEAVGMRDPSPPAARVTFYSLASPLKKRAPGAIFIERAVNTVQLERKIE